jgi:putative SOS response-associated peptidase YedK
MPVMLTGEKMWAWLTAPAFSQAGLLLPTLSPDLMLAQPVSDLFNNPAFETKSIPCFTLGASTHENAVFSG